MERELIKRLKNNDEDVFALLYANYKPLLYRYCYAFLNHTELVDDVIQEAFISVWIKREHLDPEKSLKGYLMTCCRNQIFDLLKEASKNSALKEKLWSSFQEQQNISEDSIDTVQLNELINKAIQQLSERKRLIFELSRFEGKTHEEIAKELGISKNTVKNQIVDSTKLIQNYISEKMNIAIPAVLLFSSIS